jgi:hypothetical protein
VSAQVECPLCKHVSKHANHGFTFTDADAEKVWMSDYDMKPGATLSELAGHVSERMHELGKEVFWCPCELAVWMEGLGWFVKEPYL